MSTTDLIRPFAGCRVPTTWNAKGPTSAAPVSKIVEVVVATSRLRKEPTSEAKKFGFYYRISVRTGSAEELLASLKKVEINKKKIQSSKGSAVLHLDIAHSVSLEFNAILLSLLVHGALHDPKKAMLGYWMISPQIIIHGISMEFVSPFWANEFAVIAYLGKHHVCECSKLSFTYTLAALPRILGQPVQAIRSNASVAAGKFLYLKQ